MSRQTRRIEWERLETPLTHAETSLLTLVITYGSNRDDAEASEARIWYNPLLKVHWMVRFTPDGERWYLGRNPKP